MVKAKLVKVGQQFG